MPHRRPWSCHFHQAADLGCKVSILDTTGALLAVANWGPVIPEQWPAIRGHRWHEYVNPTDLPRVLRWLQPDAGDAPPILYEAIGRCSGVDQPVIICLVKVAVPGGVWLAIGEQRPVVVAQPALPGP